MNIFRYKDGEIIQPSDRIELEYTDDGIVSLRIKQSLLDDAGTYRIVAANSEGTANTKAAVVVRRNTSEFDSLINAI